MNRQRLRPTLEPLEQRAALVGFYQGPPLEPLFLSLHGVTQGLAVSTPSAGGTTIRIAARGRILPLGLTSVEGRIQIVGDRERGTLVLNSRLSNLTLQVDGAGTSGTGLHFQIAQGMGTLPNTTFQFVREEGAGSLTLSLHAGTGREPLTATFTS